MKETKSYCVTSFGDYAEGLGTLRASGGDRGGGSEMLIVENRGGCWTLDEKMGQTYIHNESANTLAARDYKQPQAVIMTYQNVAGTLNPGSHPGSYNGQDAYNDMLVIDESSKHGQWATAQHGDGRTGESSGLYARCPSNPNRRERERDGR